MSRRKRLSLLLTLALVAVPFTAQAATITIVNQDGPGEGFNDPTPTPTVGGNPGDTLGEQRRIAFSKAAEIWGATLASTVDVTIEAQFDPLFCTSTSAVLGAAGPIQIIRDFTNAEFAGTWYHTALANALAGSDLITTSNDISATFNSSIDNNDGCLQGTNWYQGLDNNPGNDIDLMVVLLHEFAHGLGFSSFVDESTGAQIQGFPDVYGRHTYDTTTGLFWNEMTDAQRAASAINTNNVVWSEPPPNMGAGNVTQEAAALPLSAGTTSGFVEIYTPDPVQGGSSVSHWNTAALPNQLMEPAINDGLLNDTATFLADELMFDSGWAAQPGCGNGICDAGESCDGQGGTISCPQDCPSGSGGNPCGNGVCEPDEDCLSCPSDCNGTQGGKPTNRFCCSGTVGGLGGTNPVDCGDSRCTSDGFACSFTPVGGDGYCCGDGTCDTGEDACGCGVDCGSPVSDESICDDGVNNDCDFNTDCDDADCASDPACETCTPTENPEVSCSDGQDNDCDGLTDGADPDCQVCGLKGDPCSSGADCCSGVCKRNGRCG